MIKSALGRLSGIVNLRVLGAGSERGTLPEEFEILDEAADASDINDGQPASLRPYPRIQQMPEEYSRRSDTDILRNCAVLLLSTCKQSDRNITAWLEELGAEVATTTDPDLALDAIADNPVAWGLLVVVMDQILD
jgi:PleD family two-component response regulator